MVLPQFIDSSNEFVDFVGNNAEINNKRFLDILCVYFVKTEGFGVFSVQRFGNVKKCAVGKHPKSEKLGSTGQAACCARIHSRYFTGGSPSGLRV